LFRESSLFLIQSSGRAAAPGLKPLRSPRAPALPNLENTALLRGFMRHRLVPYGCDGGREGTSFTPFSFGHCRSLAASQVIRRKDMEVLHKFAQP